MKLPDDFTDAIPYLAYADLLIIMGTSLTVYPFAGLRTMVPSTCPRVLINLDKVGDIGSRADDVLLQMHCDEAVRKLCDEIGDGWREELERLWKATEGSFMPRPEPKVTVPADKSQKKGGKLEGNSALEEVVAWPTVEEWSKAEAEKANAQVAAEVSTPDTKAVDGKVSTRPEVPAFHLTPHYEDENSQPVLPSKEEQRPSAAGADEANEDKQALAASK